MDGFYMVIWEQMAWNACYTFQIHPSKIFFLDISEKYVTFKIA